MKNVMMCKSFLSDPVTITAASHINPAFRTAIYYIRNENEFQKPPSAGVCLMSVCPRFDC